MKFILIILTFFLSFLHTSAQSDSTKVDTTENSNLVINKDPRLDIVTKKEAEYNKNLNVLGVHPGKGYRLMVISTNDRQLAMNVRAQLLQRYADQKVYMSFQPPYIKIKLGNFLEKADAEKMKTEILKSNLVSNNIYVVPDTIEVKPEKPDDAEVPDDPAKPVKKDKKVKPKPLHGKE